ncbi:phosphate acyltransferase PlsX [Culicoidibacter larvae]|uniref:Phosphate acyltransferase n=1 Tax=Culicoidibacter larvae TaxID=2579976 RepID=A0A5R8QBD2_9FIRM|nr:phosphate acyltransferase PlsX [Culicoidibacter larvae]TLG73889.1 phosphate acyltransferase PlsX [Culicoidibacter larvae]
MQKYRLAIDAMGTDNAPKPEVDGAIQAIQTYSNLTITLYGDEAQVRPLLEAAGNPERIAVVHCTEQITNYDESASAFRVKKDSSMVRALQAVKDGEADAVMSAGNTGAYLSAATLMIGRIAGVDRPCLTTVFPTTDKNKKVIFADLGAVADGTAVNITQNAIIANEIAKVILKKDEPTVALLNIGTEEKKGNHLYLQAHQMMKAASGINFVGNIEARDIMAGLADVVVADGFTGNIMLKSHEGMQRAIFTVLKQEIKSGFLTKIGGLLLKSAFKNMRDTLDYTEVGGAVLAGVKVPVIKAHGNSDGFTYFAGLRLGLSFLDAHITEKISDSVQAQAVSKKAIEGNE